MMDFDHTIILIQKLMSYTPYLIQNSVSYTPYLKQNVVNYTPYLKQTIYLSMHIQHHDRKECDCRTG